MVCINDCTFCIHQHEKLKDDWIPCCDAFPDGKPFDLDKLSLRNKKECNNGIHFEPRKDIDSTL